MKYFLAIIVMLIALLWCALQVFDGYNSNNILSNQASFEIFFDANELSVDSYFNLPEGTFDPEKHIIFCKLPVDVGGFEVRNVSVRYDLTNIDCNAEFITGKDIKYESNELNNESFELFATKHIGNLQLFNEQLKSSSILAKRILAYDYEKGKINRLVISEMGFYEYCK